jgi:hypothetical protein
MPRDRLPCRTRNRLKPALSGSALGRLQSSSEPGEALLDQGQMDDLDEALDDGFALLAALAQVTRANMQEYVERFTAALVADAVLPEDF